MSVAELKLQLTTSRVRYKVSGDVLDSLCFFFQAEDGIRDLVRSRGLGDVYKRQPWCSLRDDRCSEGSGRVRHTSGADCGVCGRAVADLSLIHI